VSAILEVEFVGGPTSLSAMTLAPDPDRYRSGSIALRKLTAGRSKTRTNQLTHVGSQGGPLSQGCVANASTAGAGMQARPSTLRASDVVVAAAWCREITCASRAIAGVATAAATISAADRNLAVVMQFLHWTYEKPTALALIWRRDDRTIEVTFLHFALTPREVGRLTLANAALLVKQNDYARSLHSEF
jgi:hypothetical protein